MAKKKHIMAKSDTTGLFLMKRQSRAIPREKEKNVIANEIRKYILRDLLRWTRTRNRQMLKYREVCEGKHDYLVDQYLDELEVMIKEKIRERAYWKM